MFTKRMLNNQLDQYLPLHVNLFIQLNVRLDNKY